MSQTIDSYVMNEKTAEYVAHKVRRYLERQAKNELIAVTKRGRGWVVRVEKSLIVRFPGVADILTEH